MAKIPEFKTLDEAASFWDTHSFEDYIDDTEPVTFQVTMPPRTKPAIIRLTGRLIGDRLVFVPPASPNAPFRVHGNEIVLEDGPRIVVDILPIQQALA